MSSRSSNNDTKKPIADRAEDRRRRCCLMCSKVFMSSHIGERICPSCKGTSAWREGGYAA
jgi:hypothetical protein